MKHRGKIVEETVRKAGFGVTQLAKLLDYQRTTVYRHFQTDDLDYRTVALYGQIIHHDFTHEFPEMESYMAQKRDPLLVHGPKDMTEAIGEISRWRDKYIDLLEKYNTLLEERQKEPGERLTNGSLVNV